MKRPIYSFLLLFGLLGLLILLATLQYQWLDEVSSSEREQMEKRLQTDSQKFADDFNAEIRRAYFAFQLDSDIWLDKDWAKFNKSYELWQAQTAYPDLIGEFYYLEKDKNPLAFDAKKNEFVPTQITAELDEICENFNQKQSLISVVSPLVKNDYTIVTAIYGGGEMTGKDENGVPHIEPKIAGYLVYKLDETAVERLLSDLTQRYFPPDTIFNYNLSIVRQSDAGEIYKPEENFIATKETSDFSIPIYDLSIINFNMTTRSDIFTDKKSAIAKSIKQIVGNGVISGNDNSQAKIFIAQNSSNRMNAPSVSAKNNLKVQVFNNNLSTPKVEAKGIWQLNIRHSAGSLDQFIANTRRKNLAVSFGILSLLAVSIILIFVSAQRSKKLAQRQLDFVSSVSHEFRTPLAVIYSAGENLTDGVINSSEQTSRYGSLIKGEGKKLSAMVEQILEFAGARSGKRKYDLRETEIEEIIETALSESQTLIDEKNFAVKKEIAENLPKIAADKHALSRAIQNLIANAVKYSNENKFLKIAAKNGDGKIKIVVEDAGIGIAPNDLKHIFEPFYRSKNVVDEQIHGNGLGLSLVKQIIEAHGGKISAKSRIGKGSEFTVEIPAGKIR